MQSNPKDFKTKKIFVGGLPPTLTEGIICCGILLSATLIKVASLHIDFDKMAPFVLLLR
jgi:hypothetical protein